MNLQKASTGFRIGASVGIIVLMLGVTIAFSIYAMSSMDNQVKAVMGFTLPLEKSALQMASLQKSKEDAMNSAVRFLEVKNISGLQVVAGSFYLYDGQLSDEINHAREIANIGSYTYTQDILNPDPASVLAQLSDLEKLDSEYDQSASSLFSTQNQGNGEKITSIISDLRAKQTSIDEKQAALLAGVDSSYTHAENAVSDEKQRFLTLEIIIIVSAGIISLASGYFVNQISKDLIREVVDKTRSLQRANEKLHSLNVMKDEFISEASHELKSPLNPIYGFVELAKCGDMDKEEALAGIAKQARQIEEVANKMLDIGRIDGNRFRIFPERFDLNYLITELLEGARTNIPQGVVLEADLSGVIEVDADKVRIAQVIRNILNNAMKFTTKGRITITSSKNDDRAVVSISDTGPGIHPDILPIMFNKFVTKNQRSENSDGSGLGLYICKGITDSHGGDIHAWNNSDGGASISFSIPLQLERNLPRDAQLR